MQERKRTMEYNKELELEDLDAVAGGVADNAVTQVPSIRCPLCGQDIPVSVNTLLTADVIRCPKCGKGFDLVHNGAKKVREVLDKYSATR